MHACGARPLVRVRHAKTDAIKRSSTSPGHSSRSRLPRHSPPQSEPLILRAGAGRPALLSGCVCWQLGYAWNQTCETITTRAAYVQYAGREPPPSRAPPCVHRAARTRSVRFRSNSHLLGKGLRVVLRDRLG
jgi:hypothetical protein